jgi:hypothetical protein
VNLEFKNFHNTFNSPCLHPIDMTQIRLGRSEDNDVVLNNSTVSRHHAVITKTEDGFLLLDNNSSNGSFINGIRVQGESRLRPNEILKLGTLLVPWMSYFNIQNPNSNNRTQLVEQEQRAYEQPYVAPNPQPSPGKSVNLNHLTKPKSGARITFGILFLIIGLGAGVIGLGAIGNSQQTYDDNNVGVYDDIQVGSTYENQQSRDAGAAGVAFLVGGFALMITGIVMLATKSRSQRRHEAEIELLKKIQ